MNHRAVPAGGRSFLSSLSPRAHFNEFAIAAWTCASFYAMYYVPDNGNAAALFVPLALGAPWFVWTTMKKPVLARVDPWMTLGVFLLTFSILASYLFNANRFDVVSILGNLGATVLLFVTLYAITRKIDLDVRKLLVWQTILILPLFPVIVHTAHDQFGRMMPSVSTPNYVGMMGVVAVIGAWSVRNIFLALALSAYPLYVIAAMQSRNSMLAVMVVGAIIVWGILQNMPRAKQRKVLVLGGIGGPIFCLGLYFAGFDVFGRIYDIFANLFMLNDQYRGLGTGGSGRGMLWEAAINLWLSHVWFGVGFKSVTDLMPENMPTHNAYLDVLAELGVVGLIGYMTMVIAGLGQMFRRGSQAMPDYALRLAVLVSYVLYGMLESRAFSFGNTYSVMFLLLAFDSSKRKLAPRIKPETKAVKTPAAGSLPAPIAGAVSRTKA